MASKEARVKIKTEADTSGAKQAEQAINKTAKASKKLEQESTKGSKKIGHSAGQAALQIQDIAVQAEMGVQATRILGQQGSQILGAFGPGGAIAGAGLALGAVLIGMLGDVEKSVEDVVEELDVFLDVLDNAAKHAEKLDKAKFETLKESLNTVTKAATSARDMFVFARDNAQEASDSTQALAASIQEVILKQRELNGENVEAERAQKSKQEAEAEAAKKARDASQAAIDRSRDAQLEAKKLAQEAHLMGESYLTASSHVEKLEKRLSALRAQASAAQEVAEGTTPQLFPGATEFIQVPDTGPEVDQAKKDLEALSQQIGPLAKEVRVAQEQLGGLSERLAQAGVAAGEASEQALQIESQLPDVLDRIAQVYDVSIIQDAQKRVEENAELFQQGFKDFSETFVAQGNAQKASFQEIGEAVKNGITQDETREITSELNALFSNLNATQNGARQDILRLIALIERVAKNQNDARKRINDLDARIIK